MNTFFSNPFKNLKIPEFEKVNPFAEKASRLILKAIFKYMKHPSIIASNNVTSGSTFQFSCISVDDISKEMKEPSAHVKLPTGMHSCKDFRKKFRYFSDNICNLFNFLVNEGKFQINKLIQHLHKIFWK